MGIQNMDQITTDPSSNETKELNIDPLKIKDVKDILPKIESQIRARSLTIDPKLLKIEAVKIILPKIESQIRARSLTIDPKLLKIEAIKNIVPKNEDVKNIVPKTEDVKNILPKTKSLTKDPELRTCNICGKLFGTRQKMTMHRSQYHDNTLVQCDLCQKQYNGRKYLRDHMREHKTFKCNNCGEVVKMNSCYFHKRKCFKISPNKACLYDNCDYRGYHSKDIRRHVNLQHIKKDKKKYMCVPCNLTFDTTRDQKAHRTKDHLFKCDDCHKKYRRAHSLKKHRAKAHVSIP